MKKYFKKALTVAGSALLVGSTIGMAAAAAYPTPFVQGGNADVAVVYGSNAALSDVVGAADISTGLATELAVQTAEGGSTGGSTVTGGDSIQLKVGVDEFNLGENVTDFKSSLDVDDLGIVLANGKFYNDANDDYDYEQTMALASNMQLTHFRDRNYESYEPTIGIQLGKGDAILNYTLEFTPNSAEGGADFDDLESTFIEILGKEYFISQVSNAGDKITLLDSAITGSVNQGDSSTVTVGDETYEISIKAISSSGVILTINGQDTNRLDTGDTQKIAGENTHIGITDYQSASFEGDVSFADFSLGTGEIVLENKTEVVINGDAVSQIDDYDGYKLKAYITNDTATSMENIVLEWLADDDMFLTAESDLVMPGFEAVKFTMGEFFTAADEKVTFGTGDPMSISTDVKDGSVTIDLFYLNSTEDGFGTNLGASSAQHLITNATGGDDSTVSLNLENETYFVASWMSGRNSETYVYELSNIKDNSGKNETTLTNLAGGSNVVFKDTLDEKTVGRIKLTLSSSSEEDENATVLVEPVSGGSVYTDRIFTAEGLQILLPVEGNSSADARLVNLTSDTSWAMNFSEEDEDGNIAEGTNFSVTLGIDTNDGFEANALSGVTELQIGRTGDDYVAYVESNLATRIDWTKDTASLDAMEITYHGSEAYASVFVAETGATVVGGTSTTGGTATELGAVTVEDNEVSSVQGKNLIVVGGSCINAVAAELIGESACGADFTAKTDVAAGEFLIESFDNPYTSGKVAMLVAGYNAADTKKAVTYLTNNDVDTTVGTKLKGTSATEATLVTA